MAGEPVDKIVLAAMRFVGNDHDVAPGGKQWMHVALFFGKKLLNGREDHAARFDRQLAAQIGPAGGLHWRLAQQGLATRKCAEELVVEVVAVGEHDDRWILHGRLADDGPRVKGHGQALARPLGVPDDANAPVAALAPGGLARFVPPLRLGGALIGLLHRSQGLAHGHPHRVELVIAGHLLGEHTATAVLKCDEVAHEIEETPRLEYAFNQHLQLG